MSKLVNPTRMELMKLRKQQETTRRGHKLLKDKQDEFIHQFIEIIKDYKTLRNDIEQKVIKVTKYYQKALVKMNQDKINSLLENNQSEFKLDISSYKMMGVDLPLIKLNEEFKTSFDYDFQETTPAFDYLITYSEGLLKELLNLAEIETKVEKMIIEIEKSKRRVNAIENIILKEIEENIRVIKMKLSDLERSNTIRMMKSKEIILNKNNQK